MAVSPDPWSRHRPSPFPSFQTPNPRPLQRLPALLDPLPSKLAPYPFAQQARCFCNPIRCRQSPPIPSPRPPNRQRFLPLDCPAPRLLSFRPILCLPAQKIRRFRAPARHWQSRHQDDQIVRVKGGFIGCCRFDTVCKSFGVQARC